ncbi:MAG: metallophosphoesterase [Synergistaceae bacterium]|nr:metallophosphoesterase [Synergistaceae bacterium]
MGCAAAFHAYLWWRLYQGFGAGRWMWGYFAVVATFILFPVARYHEIVGDGRVPEIFFALTITDYVIAGMICSLLVLMEILKLGLFLWDRAAKTHKEDFLTSRRAVTLSVVVVFCSVIYGFYEAWDVREVNFSVHSSKLPRNVESLRIVQISDIHLGGLYSIGHLRRVMEMVRAAKPDIFVVTGDLVDGNMASRGAEAALIADHGAKYGAFAIVGNHEYYNGLEQAVEFMERAGLTVLYDRMVDVAGIAIVGLDDLTTVWPAEVTSPRDSFVLLLRHRPHVIKTSRGKFDLQLSGHTHGGQLWPLGLLSQRVHGYVQGLSKQGESYVYVSNGTGFWGPPMRLLTPPEVTVIDLARDSASTDCYDETVTAK